ncbi:alpha/beta fold hydrolase [uncultured Corynebacterium sp.]|uniref:alpha/beta fold hydrolase n=1 Tax=uncultured Corynebacterium sp. TaxID=159447 RepID=UPI0025D4B954|nr:alpha/beta hydrolase [uncultured Corynebacterium sp.]
MCASLLYDEHRPFSVGADVPGAASVVLLHGVGTARWMWWRQIEGLARDHHLLVPDLPGHGETNVAGIGWRGLADAADRVADLIAECAPRSRAHVVGLSLGGHVAMTLLERSPDLVDSAVLSGVTVRPWPHRWFLGAQTRITVSSLKRPSTVTRLARAMGLPPGQRRALEEGIAAMDVASYGAINREVAGYAASRGLTSAPNPTLVVAGGREGKVIRSAVDELPRRMESARGALAPGVGHGWNIEEPDLFTDMIGRWVGSRSLAPGLVSPEG